MSNELSTLRSSFFGNALIIFVFGAVTQGSVFAQNGYQQTIAETGGMDPGGDEFSDFSSVLLNDVGQLAFRADFAVSTPSGIYRADGAGMTTIVRSGDSVPDGNGELAGLSHLSLNNRGDVAFNASVSNTSGGLSNTGVFRANGNSLVEIARRGQTVEDGNGTYHFFSNLDINNSGRVVFEAALEGTAGGSDDDLGFYLGSGGPAIQVARQGGVAPDGIGIFDNLNSTPRINDLSQVVFRTSMVGPSDFGVFRYAGGAVEQILLTGQGAPDGDGVMIQLGTRPQINQNGQVSFRGRMFQTDSGLNESAMFLGDATGLATVVRTLDPAPDGNGAFGTFTSLSTHIYLNDVGQVAFEASLSGTDNGTDDNSGLFRGSTNGVIQVAREGELSPDNNGVFADLRPRGLNDSGQVLFTANLNGSAAGEDDNIGIFVGDGIDTMLVVRKGQMLSGDNIASIDFFPQLNELGQVAHKATLVDNREVVRLFTPDLHWRQANIGSWDNSSNWTLGLDPAHVHRTFIDPDSGTAVFGPNSNIHVQQLVVGGGLGNATLVLNEDVTIEVDNGLGITPNGTLMGTGIIDGNVSVRGTLSPSDGSSGPGDFIFTGNLELVDATVDIELFGAGLDDFDRLRIGDDMFVDGLLNVSVDSQFMLGDGMEFVIAQVGNQRFGEFDGLGELDLVGTFGGTDLFITYTGGDGNDISLFTAVPEPGSFALLLAVCIAATMMRRRRLHGFATISNRR